MTEKDWLSWVLLISFLVGYTLGGIASLFGMWF